MSLGVLKSAALWAVSKGLRLPEAPLDRLGELIHLRQLLEQLRIDCVLDVGANEGQFAAELRGLGFTGLIRSFEPVRQAFDLLRARFAGDPRWSGFNMALGSVERSQEIVISRQSVMNSLLEPLKRGDILRREIVSVRRLDALFDSDLGDLRNRRIFLKMDTQGYDLEVFKGASGVTDLLLGLQSELSVQPLYEGMPHYLEALQTYEAAGFELYNLSVVNRTDSGGLLEVNCFMRKGIPRAAGAR